MDYIPYILHISVLVSIIIFGLVCWLLHEMDERQKLYYAICELYPSLNDKQKHIIDHGWEEYLANKKDHQDEQ